MQVAFTLTGLTSALFHADDVEAMDDVKVWRDQAKKDKNSVPGDDRSPPWTWHVYLHTDGTHIALPSECLMTALRIASAKIPLPGGKGSESFKKISQSGIFISTDYCRFTNDGKQIPMAAIRKLKAMSFSDQKKAVQAMGFDLLVKRAKPKGSNGKHVRVRAQFNQWEVSGSLLVNDPKITFSVLKEMFDLAGRYCGLLDWRPSSPESSGSHGMFTAELKLIDR